MEATGPSISTAKRHSGGDAPWRRTGLPLEDLHGWQLVFEEEDDISDAIRRAERLANYGWRPEDLERARTDSKGYLQEINGGADLTNVSTERVAALALLTRETLSYYDRRSEALRRARATQIVRLARGRNPLERWSYERIGAFVGLTRQRVWAILDRNAI